MNRVNRQTLLSRSGRPLALWLACAAFLHGAPADAGDYRIEVCFSPQVRAERFTGRVYLFFSRQHGREPRRGLDWFHPEPIAAVDIENWKPGEPLTFAPTIREWMLAFPRPLAELELTGYRVQAVARFNPLERTVGTGTGNAYSSPVELSRQGDRLSAMLKLDKLVAAQPFNDNRWCRLLAVRSRRLSEFHHREVVMQGAVLLPASYHDATTRRYPVIFNVPGFGGTHRLGYAKDPIGEQNAGGVEFIRVTLDPGCPLGHHAFADSANNGPAGSALVEEFLPELDRLYRTDPRPAARFLTGHSSGGWSTLWLQVAYPETFGGVWSTAPDPVDFRDFQQIDIYRAGENMYRDRQGNRRPLARGAGDAVALWYDDFDRMEEVLGPGGQLHSFEAVFGPRGADGSPVRLWNRKTGEIDPAVAESWKAYDLRQILETNWNRLAPHLTGKLHIFMGDRDTFYLEGATRLLKQSLERLGSDATVEIVADKNHRDLLSPELAARIRAEMVDSYLKNSPPR